MVSRVMAVTVTRTGDSYTAAVGPPEVAHEWVTDRPYGRDELRLRIEDLGVHPVDVADAFYQADLKAGYPPRLQGPPRS